MPTSTDGIPEPARRPPDAGRRWLMPAGSAAGADELGLVGCDHGLDPVLHLELAEHVADMGLDRLQPEHEVVGDLGVAEAGREQPQYLPLAVGQPLQATREFRGPR